MCNCAILENLWKNKSSTQRETLISVVCSKYVISRSLWKALTKEVTVDIILAKPERKWPIMVTTPWLEACLSYNLLQSGVTAQTDHDNVQHKGCRIEVGSYSTK